MSLRDVIVFPRSSLNAALFFSQKMAKLPDDESVWSLSTPASLTENDDIANAFLTIVNENRSSKSKKNSGCSSWPPVNWKPAPGFCSSRENRFRLQTVTMDQSVDLGKSDFLGEDFVHEKTDMTITEINKDGVVGPDSALSPIVEIQPCGVYDQPQSGLEASSDPTNVVVESVCPEDRQSKNGARDQLLSSTPGAQQAMLTGRLGELVAFRYLSENFGAEVVNWVNQDKETGLPYDIVLGEEDIREYFEVKASRYAKKDWFVISTREWLFAAEKGDSFSIVYVILSGQNLTRITVYKNPVKLCQLGKLQLAVMTPRL